MLSGVMYRLFRLAWLGIGPRVISSIQVAVEPREVGRRYLDSNSMTFLEDIPRYT